jgi:chromosome segregation ATPase
LQEQFNECIIFKERADQLQKSLDESLVWKSYFETSFSKREACDLGMRIRTLEEDLKSITHTKLELQQQLIELLLREAATIQKCEGITINMKEAVEKLEGKNRELEREKQMLNEHLSSLESVISSNPTNHFESEELKQKITFQEEQIAKLDEQLQCARETLTLEREKYRQLELDLWKKEKELSGVKIDVRIANRETKTAESEINKPKEEAGLFEAKLKVT